MFRWTSMNQRVLLLLVILVAFVFADGLEVIKYPPLSLHQWRQSDCVSYAKTYYQRNSGFFEPRNFNLLGKDGRVASEFPVIYYIQAKLALIFGFQYWLLRGVNFLIYLTGLIYLFNCIKFWIKDPLLAMVPVLILATTPYYFYYGVNYLPNVPAICFSFIGLYYILRYEEGGLKSLKYLAASTVCFTLATLLKPPDGGLVWLAYLSYSLINVFVGKRKIKDLFPLIICSAIIAICLISWYEYAIWYDHNNLNIINLIGILPIWDMDKTKIVTVFTDRICKFWFSIYQHPYILSFLAFLFIVYIIKWRSCNGFLRLFTLFLLIGTFIYCILWYKTFEAHDYYQLIFVIPATFISITVFEFYSNKIAGKLNRIVRYFMVFLLLSMAGLSIYNNRIRQEERYATADFNYKLINIYEAAPFLRKVGITPSDIIISVPDFSPNITLEAFGNPGYTTLFQVDSYTHDHFINKGAKYLIISDSNDLHNPLYTPYTSKFLGGFKGIYVFDLR